MSNPELIDIRPAEAGDEAGMGYVHVVSWRSAYQEVLPPKILEKASVQAQSSFWRPVVDGRERDQVAYVALDEARQVVGFASGGPQQGNVSGFDAEIYDIYLLPDVQRRGIGRRLVKVLGEVMLNRGYGSLSIWMPAQNPSRGFCRALGGAPVAEKAVDLQGLSVPAVAYGWPSLFNIT